MELAFLVMAALMVWLIVRTNTLANQVAQLRREVQNLAAPDSENRSQQPAASADTLVQPRSRADPSPEKPNWLVRYFTDGNLIVRIGVLVLLCGVGFLVSYAVEHSQVPVSLRLWGITLFGAGLVGTGWYLRGRRLAYGLALQGGGLGVVYLVVYSALRLYQVIGPGMAVALLIGLVLAGIALSLLQNSQVLAGLALTGGFLAPLLTSSEQGSHVVLFSYYLLLNAGIAVMAWYRPWRGLNLLGFGFTVLIGIVWGASGYSPGDYLSAQVFLVLFFLLFLGVSVLFSWRQPPRLKGLVDGSLVFGVPTMMLLMQAWLVGSNDAHLAWSTALLGLFYGGLAFGVWRFGPGALEVLALALLGIALGFATLTIPLALGERLTSAIWVAEALGLLWLGLRQHQLMTIVGAMVLYAASGLAMLEELDPAGAPQGAVAVLLDAVGILLMAVGAAVGTRLLLATGAGTRRWQYQWALVLALYTGFWLSVLLLRIVYNSTGMAWTVEAIGESVVAQATLSIAWTGFGLLAALYAVRTGFREVWLVGAAVIAVVVIKLFVVDLAGSGTLARVVSFLGVGGLLLLVGYFAPMPEREQRGHE